MYIELAKRLEEQSCLAEAATFRAIAEQLRSPIQATNQNSIAQKEVPSSDALTLNEDPIVSVVRQEFDTKFYLSQNPDVKAAGVDPVEHYLLTWNIEFRKPTEWFDTKYYLDSNPDVKEKGINPFWHYLVSGRKEGRHPQKPGGYRRELLDTLTPLAERVHYQDLPEVTNRISYPQLISSLGKVCSTSKGITVSISHDCYTKVIGGTQIFISDEQKEFNSQQYAYLHVSPTLPSSTLIDEDASPFDVQIILNATYIGITSYEDLAKAIREVTARISLSKIFVIHCVLGHRISGIISVNRSLRPESNYFWIHDYSSLCLGYNLLRNNITYCGAPSCESIACRTCVYGQERTTYLKGVENLFNSVRFHVVAPSQAALNIWINGTTLPYIDATVQEHSRIEIIGYRSELLTQPHLHMGKEDDPIRVAFIGFPSVHKGWPIFLHLLSKISKLPEYKFYHFGSDIPPHLGHPVEMVPVTVTAQTRDNMTEALIAKEIDIVLMLSPWPETFSYATHEALAAGSLVIALEDSGNIANVIRATKQGVVLGDEKELVQFFSEYQAVSVVEQWRKTGIKIGKLVNIGTTASLVFHNQALSEVSR